MKHTKGKWKAQNDRNGDWGIIGSELDLALVHGYVKESEANAKLIASAPELLDSCIFLIESLGDLSNLTGMQSQAHHKARLVIEKATL